jgi:hypothetical protein
MFFFGAHMRRIRIYALNPGVTIIINTNESGETKSIVQQYNQDIEIEMAGYFLKIYYYSK